MSNAESSPQKATLSRWSRPRLYVTIVAFYQLVLGVAAIIYPYFYFEGFGGFYFVYYFGVLIYLIGAAVSVYSLLKSKPSFAFPITFTLLIAIVALVWTVGNTYDLVNYCRSGSETSCQAASSFTFPMMGISALTAAMAAVLLKGRKLYERQIST